MEFYYYKVKWFDDKEEIDEGITVADSLSKCISNIEKDYGKELIVSILHLQWIESAECLALKDLVSSLEEIDKEASKWITSYSKS